jgi:hypothetical protein
MTTFAQHRATVESFADCMHGHADKEALARILAENVVLIGPLSDEPLTIGHALCSPMHRPPIEDSTTNRQRVGRVRGAIPHDAA